MVDNQDLLGLEGREHIHTMYVSHWGTDGSYTNGKAGYGIKAYGGEGELTREAYAAHGVYGLEYFEACGEEVSVGLVGHQTINRAEAMAVLHTMLLASREQDIHLYIDSQTTIDSMQKLWTDRKARHRHYKDIANYSIFHTINQLRQERYRRGTAVHLHKVAAHQRRYEGVAWADICDLGDRLNARADDLAKAGREAGVACREAWHNCARATLQTSVHLEESSSYGTVYNKMDAAVLAHVRRLKGSSPRLRAYDREGVWEAASRRNADLRDPVNLFSFGLPYNPWALLCG